LTIFIIVKVFSHDGSCMSDFRVAYTFGRNNVNSEDINLLGESCTLKVTICWCSDLEDWCVIVLVILVVLVVLVFLIILVVLVVLIVLIVLVILIVLVFLFFFVFFCNWILASECFCCLIFPLRRVIEFETHVASPFAIS